MAKQRAKPFNATQYMQLAIEAMHQSIDEPRSDGKVSPKVGAVIIKPDGTVETAFRGELRHGDHAEFTLLERKKRSENLASSILFATLEPCAPGARRHPKLGCAERIVNARIKEVWIGIEDPDPDVDRKGIKYLQDHGIKVHMFTPNFQKQIKEANKNFLKQARQRAVEKEEKKEIILSPMEKSTPVSGTDVFSKEAIDLYLQKAKINIKYGSVAFWNHFEAIGMVERVVENGKEALRPTGFGIILFAKRPRDKYQQAVLKAKVKYGQGAATPQDFDQPLVMIPYDVENWLKKVLPSKISRSSFERKTNTEFPIEPLREAVINALVHRDYEIAGAKTYIEIDDNKIVVKSAGLPVDPITLDDVKQFRAPSLSRNPKITYVFNQMGLMEEAELGMETFRTVQEKHGLPLPEYTYHAPYLSLTFSRSIAAKRSTTSNKAIKELTNEELTGFEWIKSQKEISAKEYAKHFSYTARTASRHLSKMYGLGLLNTNGENVKSPSLRYSWKKS